ncbi:hypothetical protein EB001_11065, partial [bacterium]|nr:hypothetical protein [bacterium]
MPGIKEEIKKQALVSGYDKPVTTPSIKDDIKAEGLKKYSASESNDLTKDYFSRKQTAERTSILSEDQFKGLTKGVSFDDASDILERPFNPITEDIGYLAATEQSVGYQIGAFANQLQGAVIGQAIESIGYLGDVAHWGERISGGEGDWGNWLSDIGTSYQDLTREGTPIYQTKPGEFNPSSSGWWFNNGVSIGSSLALLIPAMGVTSLLGKAARATKLFDAAVKLGAKVGLGAEQVGTLGTVLGRSLASRQMENMMEANGTFKEVEQKYLNLGYDEAKAKTLASEAASDVYKSNWPLIIQDVMQMALIAKGPLFTKAIDSAAVARAAGTSVVGAMFKAGYTKGWDMLTEGMEEAYQFVVAEEAKYAIDASMGLKPKSTFGDRLGEYTQDGQMWTNALFGALGAGVMQATAPLLNKLQGGKSEAQIRVDEIKSRATTFSAFSKLYKEAAQSGNEFGINAAHMGLETDLAVRAYQTGNLDLILNDIENYKSMSAEEKEANGFSPDTDFNKVKKGVEETVELIKTISKNYDSLVVPKAAYLSRLTTLYESQKTNLKSKESLLLSSFPGLNNLSSEGRTVFDTFVNFKALQHSLKLNKNTLAKSNLTEFSKGELENKIAKDEIELAKLEKQVDGYMSSDELNKDDVNIINNSIDTPFGHNIISNKTSQLLIDRDLDASIKELAHLSKKETVAKIKADIAKNQKAAEDKAKADEIAAKNKANEDALNDNKAKASADQQQAATTTIPSDEEILATINSGDTINMTDAELEQLADQQGVTLQDAKLWQKQAIEDFNKKKESYVAAAGKATKTTSAEIITNTTNDDNIPTPANPEELEEDIEPKGAAKITTGLALAWKSAGNLSSDVLDQVNNKELSDFLENPNIDLSKYDLEVSIDWDKIDRLEVYAGLREAIANGTADVGMIPIKAVITLNGKPVTANGKPYTLYVHDTNYDFSEKHKADAIQEVLDLKNAVVANQNKKITAKIVDRSEGHLNSDIDSNGKFVQHSLLESISDKLENLKFTVGGNGGVYMSIGSNKDTHPDLESFTSAKPGAVYVIVKRADGLKMPLRTWVAGISEEDSNVVYSTYKAILNNPEIYQDKLSKEFKESVNLSNLPLDLSK